MHSMSGFKKLRRRVDGKHPSFNAVSPLCGSSLNRPPQTKKLLKPMIAPPSATIMQNNQQPGCDLVALPPDYSHPSARSYIPLAQRKQIEARQRHHPQKKNPEQDDCVARVRNLDNFDPEVVSRQNAERKRVLRAVQTRNKEAHMIAEEAVRSANLAIAAAEDIIEEMVRAAMRANAEAARVAWLAAAAAEKSYSDAMAKVAEEIERQRIERAAKAAFGASVMAYRAAANEPSIQEQLIPVDDFIEVELARIQMEDIQNRVLELMLPENSGVDCNLISINLIKYEIKLLEQIQFEAGTADIKQDSNGLLGQLTVAKKCISQTCGEFKVPDMHWRVEGHTAKSKKSHDGGMKTSNERARAVCNHLRHAGIGGKYLHPEGCGCFRPPTAAGADPRRVEVHVMRAAEVSRRPSCIDLGLTLK